VALSGELREINIRDFVELCVLRRHLFVGLRLCLRRRWNMIEADDARQRPCAPLNKLFSNPCKPVHYQRLVAIAGNYP
jgi:hypothetical protein